MRLGPKVLASVLFAVAVVEYAHTVSFDYAWDDKLVITANEFTLRGVKGLPAIFTRRVSIPFKSEYRPIPQAMFAIEHDLFKGSPHGSHALNVLWYALTCVCVYWFVQFTFPRFGPAFAFLAALLFTVHPLHVEVVANIKGRDEILCLLFGLSAIMLTVKGIELKRWWLLLAGAASLAMACLSKSNAVAFLPLLPLVAWLRQKDWKISRSIVILACIAGICSIAAAVLIRHGQKNVSNSLDLHLSSTVLNNIFLWSAHPQTIIPTALVIIARYVRLFLYPYPLIHLYGYNQIPLNSWRQAAPWLILAGLLVLAVAVLKQWCLKPPWAFGVVFFAVTYSVYSNFFFFAPDTMADRYMFVPSVGLVILVATGLYRLLRTGHSVPKFGSVKGADARRQTAKELLGPLGGALSAQPVCGVGRHNEAAATVLRELLKSTRGKLVLGFFAVSVTALFATSVTVSADWRNDSTLIHNRIRYMQQNAAAQAIYGYILNKDSEDLPSPQLQQQQKAAAMNAFMEAIRIYPDFQAAWIAVGKLFAQQQSLEKAELAFLKGQTLEPLTPDSYFCLGTLYLSLQDSDLAIPYLERAVLLDPKMEDGYVMLGRAYLQANNIENLGAMAKTARQWFPNNASLEALQATYYFRKADYARASELANRAIAKEPQNLLALSILSSPMTQEYSTRVYAGHKATHRPSY